MATANETTTAFQASALGPALAEQIIARKMFEGMSFNSAEITEMADGSGEWAVIGTYVDADDNEHVYRTRVTTAGYLCDPEKIERNW